MAADHKHHIQQLADKVTDWLRENRAEFEGEGVNEDGIAGSLGISEDEAAEVVDYLENHEEVVRYPQGETAPSRFLLKPGRNWPPTAASAS
ncbi:MAG TPA: hypothetical protein VM911_12090 [Pyrinomonadaceae bacterium]|jgi:hypothetical protein|nr:hypothetical protein [Pyrinomonadaceae bacterium]